MPSEIIGLTPATQEVFEQVSQLECIKDLFLCGGTGQSLQMNHRLSEDLDFELIGLRKERPELDFGAIISKSRQNSQMRGRKYLEMTTSSSLSMKERLSCLFIGQKTR